MKFKDPQPEQNLFTDYESPELHSNKNGHIQNNISSSSSFMNLPPQQNMLSNFSNLNYSLNQNGNIKKENPSSPFVL